MELVVITGCEVYDAVVESVERIIHETVVVREVVHVHHVLVRAREQRLKWSEEPDERVRNAFHLLQHPVLHLATVQHLPISRAGLYSYNISSQ